MSLRTRSTFLFAYLVIFVLTALAGCSRSWVTFAPSESDPGGSCECTSGCCLPDGTCAPGTADDACGNDGEVCDTCVLGNGALSCHPTLHQCVPVCACGNQICEPMCGEDAGACPD